MSKTGPSLSEAFLTEDDARNWIERLKSIAARGVTPAVATMTLGQYGDEEWDLSMRGLGPRRWTRIGPAGV